VTTDPEDSNAQNLGPQHIYEAILKQEKNMPKLLQIFRNANTEPLTSFGLPTPQHKNKTTFDPDEIVPIQKSKAKKGEKKKGKNSKNMPINKIAQEVLAKNCGIIGENKSLDDMTL
jgi:hypothetical protein